MAEVFAYPKFRVKRRLKAFLLFPGDSPLNSRIASFLPIVREFVVGSHTSAHKVMHIDLLRR